MGLDISTGKEPSIFELITAIEKRMQILKDAQESDAPSSQRSHKDL